jgi:hypothetical protein
LDRAYQSFFRRVRNGEKPGFPRFKSSNRYHSITFDRYGFRIRPNGHLHLSKIGEIKMVMHRPIPVNSDENRSSRTDSHHSSAVCGSYNQSIPNRIKICVIKQDSVGDWWALIVVELPDVATNQERNRRGCRSHQRGISLEWRAYLCTKASA